MMKKLSLTTATLSVVLLGAALMSPTAKAQTTDAPAPAPVEKEATPVAPKTAQGTFEIMLGALENDSYAAFISRGDENFQKTLTAAQFKNVVLQLAAPFKRGAITQYLGPLKKGTTVVHLWRLRFGAEGDDSLVQMSLEDDKVTGFWLM